VKIAVSGKGGVGKTFIAGTLAWLFAQDGHQVIAIDADSSPNLALTLGLTPDEAERIQPIAENTELIRLKTGTDYPGVYNLTFTVDDIIEKYALPTPAGAHLLVMGSVASMGSGCTCQANALVRALLRHLVVKRDEEVIIDLEAGVEHLGRGTADRVDIMLIVSDANEKSLRTAKRIAELSAGAGPKSVYLVGNMIEDAGQEERLARFAGSHGLALLGCVPFDRGVRDAGIEGKTVFFGADGGALRSVRALREKIINAANEAREEIP